MKYPQISGVALVESNDTMDIRRIYAASTTNIHLKTVVMCTASSGLFSENVRIPLISVSIAVLLYL